MTNKFTASEVRRLSNRIPRSNDEIADAQEALRAFADMLEAQEKAVPVAWMHFYRKNGGGTRMWFPTLVPKAEPQDGYEWVETRPLQENIRQTPPDAERLAEALRELVVACEEHDAMVSRIIGHPAGWNAQYLNSARQALAAHSAQAQPPAASVTDAVFPSHRACVPYENHPGKRIVGFVIDKSHPWWGKCGLTEPLSALEAALAAQEKPNG